MSDKVTVEVFKWPRRLRYRQVLTRLGSDEYGEWFGAVRFVPTFHDGTIEPAEYLPRVIVIPLTGWWRARFTPGEREVYVDVITEPEWVGRDHVSYIDLELDVELLRDGRVRVLDEDDFAAVAPSLPVGIREQAISSCARMERALLARAEPFGAVGETWLATFMQSLDDDGVGDRWLRPEPAG